MRFWAQKGTGLSLAACLLLGSTGCGVELEDESDLEIDELSQPYLVGEYYLGRPNVLLRFAQASAGGVRVCLSGTGFTSSNRASYENAARAAIVAWVDAVRPVSTVPLITASDVSFACSPHHVEIKWTAGATGLPNGQPGEINLFGDPPGALLHEFGHVFGLHDTYVGTATNCQPGQEWSLMCDGDAPAPAADDIDAIQRAYCTLYPSQCKAHWDASSAFCAGSGKQLLAADFTGDGRADLVCHDPVAGTQQFAWAAANGTFPGVSWTNSVPWCPAPFTLHAGDFNGDGRSDLLCHNGSTGATYVNLTNAWGYFVGSPSSFTLSYCSGTGRTLAGMGDFNGDGRTDLLCRWSDGTVLTQHATAAGAFPGVSFIAGWTGLCSTSGRLLAGDINRDGLDDLVCNEPSTGAVRVAYAAAGGAFSSVGFSAALGFCTASNTTLELADFNGDGRDDLYCRSVHGTDVLGWWTMVSGHWLALAQSDNTFHGLSRYWSIFNDAANTRMVVGDFDRDSSPDMAFVTNTGALAVEYARLRWSSVESGLSHGCALNANGFTRCWGDNGSLQVEAPRGERFKQLALGAAFSCGVRSSDSTVKCWSPTHPMATSTPSTAFKTLSAGNFHACGIKLDNSIGCWLDTSNPSNNMGQAPASVAGNFTAVATGAGHSCALTGGNAQCWGSNFHGQAPASQTGPFDQITAGWQFTCARKTDQNIACWGNNTSGQAPASVSGPFVHLTAGATHACAQRPNGTVQCWGANGLGQSSAPPDAFVTGQVRAGGDHTCGILLRDNSLKCWGDASDGQTTPPF